MLYHAFPAEGIQTIIPQVSSHNLPNGKISE